LKNIINTFRVPSEYEEAISSYLSGLQGEGARKRLSAQAQTIITETNHLKGEKPEDDMATDSVHESARNRALRAQLKATKGMLRNKAAAELAEADDHKALVTKRKRAVRVLRSLVPTYASPESQRSDGAAEDDDAGLPPKRKKQRRTRKSRTGVPDDDDTDETSSVSSVSSEAGNSEDEKRKDVRLKGKGGTKEDEEDSGSEESSVVSSSSESDSGSEDSGDDADSESERG
jgi:hypothetical protein